MTKTSLIIHKDRGESGEEYYVGNLLDSEERTIAVLKLHAIYMPADIAIEVLESSSGGQYGNG